MEWKRVKLKDVVVVSTGFPFDGHLYSHNGIRVLRGENIANGLLRWDDRLDKRWDQPFVSADIYSLQENDIVLQMDGNVGRNKAQIRNEDLPMYIAQRVGCIRAKENISQEFIFYVISTSAFAKYLSLVSTGTSIQHVSISQIEDFTFSIPITYQEQIQIAKVLSNLDRKIALNRQINKNLCA